MEQMVEIAESMQKKAWDVIKDTRIIEIWSSIGATINLVGSLKMGLLINNRDIDFHIYTTPFTLSMSFSAVSRLAENRRIKKPKMLRNFSLKLYDFSLFIPHDVSVVDFAILDAQKR